MVQVWEKIGGGTGRDRRTNIRKVMLDSNIALMGRDVILLDETLGTWVTTLYQKRHGNKLCQNLNRFGLLKKLHILVYLCAVLCLTTQK